MKRNLFLIMLLICSLALSSCKLTYDNTYVVPTTPSNVSTNNSTPNVNNSTTTTESTITPEPFIKGGTRNRVIENTTVGNNFKIVFFDNMDGFYASPIYMSVDGIDILINVGKGLEMEGATAIHNILDTYVTDGKLEYLFLTHKSYENQAFMYFGDNYNLDPYIKSDGHYHPKEDYTLYKYPIDNIIWGKEYNGCNVKDGINGYVNNGTTTITSIYDMYNADGTPKGTNNVFNITDNLKITVMFTPSTLKTMENAIYNDVNYDHMFLVVEYLNTKYLLGTYDDPYSSFDELQNKDILKDVDVMQLEKLSLWTKSEDSDKSSSKGEYYNSSSGDCDYLGCISDAKLNEFVKFINPEAFVANFSLGSRAYTDSEYFRAEKRNELDLVGFRQPQITAMSLVTDKVYVTSKHLDGFEDFSETEDLFHYEPICGAITLTSDGNTIGLTSTNTLKKLKDDSWLTHKVHIIWEYVTSQGSYKWLISFNRTNQAKSEYDWIFNEDGSYKNPYEWTQIRLVPISWQ